jgi:hypothetical protein
MPKHILFNVVLERADHLLYIRVPDVVLHTLHRIVRAFINAFFLIYTRCTRYRTQRIDHHDFSNPYFINIRQSFGETVALHFLPYFSDRESVLNG